VEKEIKVAREIKFQAITPGLGFHPFSDGLPYAPVSKTAPRPASLSPNLSTPRTAPLPEKKPAAYGSGAVAAGPPTFARPSARIHVPVATRTVAAAQPVLQTPHPSLSINIERYGSLYLCKRIMAYVVDTTLNLTLLAAGLSFALWNQEVQPDVLMNPGLLILGSLFCLIFNWAIITAQEIAFGTSVGKRIFGLALRGSTMALFLRAFFFLPSLAFCGIGLAWGLFDRQRRCWHDLVVNIQPIETVRL
jgi:hypothetical protein